MTTTRDRALLAREDLAEARKLFEDSKRLFHVYYATVNAAEKAYGAHGPLISGIVRDHFPQVVKESLRGMIQLAQGARTSGYMARPARVRDNTMNKLCRAVDRAWGEV